MAGTGPRRGKKEKWSWRRVLAAVVAVFLALAMAFSIILSALPVAFAVSQADIDALKQKSSQLDSQRSQLEKELSQLQADKKDAMSQKTVLEQQVNVLQSKIDTTTALIQDYDSQIAQRQADLEAAQEKEEQYYALFCRRVRSMEEGGTTSYWEILFEADSFSDLLDRAAFISDVMSYDNGVVDQLLALQEQIAGDKAALEQARQEQEEARAALETSKADLKAKEAKVDKLLAEIAENADETKDALDDLESQAAAMDDEIVKLQKELERQLAAQNKVIQSEAGYLWPLGGYTNLSSLYAGRIDPFTGKPATHTGIDVPAPKGTPIKAAKSGVVITSGYSAGGYGNYVVISHGNGASTLYAHMSSRAAEVGQTVSQGQVIGYVGTTGRSTGNHLHFEVRVNSSRVDPASCFTGLTYKGSAI